MDPLLKVKEAYNKGILPKEKYSLILKRFPIVISGINRIEKASGVNFPIAYVDPSIIISSPNPNSFDFGILFARTIPIISQNTLQVVIQISAPLVAYGLKGTIHAILAHEFLHYLELIRKISIMLYPIIPGTSIKSLSIFNITENKISFESINNHKY